MVAGLCPPTEYPSQPTYRCCVLVGVAGERWCHRYGLRWTVVGQVPGCTSSQQHEKQGTCLALNALLIPEPGSEPGSVELVKRRGFLEWTPSRGAARKGRCCWRRSQGPVASGPKSWRAQYGRLSCDDDNVSCMLILCKMMKRLLVYGMGTSTYDATRET